MVLQRPMENGWPECDLSDTERLTIPGTALSLPIQKGQPHAILQAFFRDMNEFIEPANNARGYNDEGSWTENNSVYTSNHKGATAIDWNWSDHPVNFMAPDPRAGWNGSVLIKGDQTPAVRELLAWYEGMVYWGNDWSSFRDSMHFQVGYNTYGSQNFDRVHSFIQRKIRAAGFSDWMFKRGRATSPTEFVDHPEQMETIENAAQVAVYYWTVSRPQLNALADARNLEGATKAINGGLNGLADRRRFYDLFLAANADLLDPTDDPIEELLMLKAKSWSIYANPGEPEIPVVDLIRAIDAKVHRDLTDEDARAGDPEAIRRVARTAAGLGANRSPGAINHAVAVLNEINATNPQAILDANPGRA